MMSMVCSENAPRNQWSALSSTMLRAGFATIAGSTSNITCAQCVSGSYFSSTGVSLPFQRTPTTNVGDQPTQPSCLCGGMQLGWNIAHDRILGTEHVTGSRSQHVLAVLWRLFCEYFR